MPLCQNARNCVNLLWSREVSNIGVYEGDEITGQSRIYKMKDKKEK
jgi:hypothetical protein